MKSDQIEFDHQMKRRKHIGEEKRGYTLTLS